MSATFNGVRRTLHAAISRHKTPGLQYVVNQSATMFEAHEGLADTATGRPALAGTTMMAHSVSKIITAAAILPLVEAGRLRLDEPVARYIDWQPYGGQITIRQLLSHTGCAARAGRRRGRPVSGYFAGAAFSFCWNSGYVVSAPPRVAISGRCAWFRNSTRNGFSPGR